MKILKQFKKITATIVALELICSPTNITVFAEENTKLEVFDGNGFEVSYSVKNNWESNYIIDASIKNTTDTTIEDWCLIYLSTDKINDIWNATAEQNDNITIISNSVYNQDIAPGETVTYSFCVDTEKLYFPDKFELISEPSLLDESAYSVSFDVINDWGEGYNAGLTITNNSDHIIEDWYLNFDWTEDIDYIWNAQYSDFGKNHKRLNNAGYNQNIAPGDSVTIGLQNWSHGAPITDFNNIQLYEYGHSRRSVIEELTSAPNVSINTISFKYNKDENYYNIYNKCNSLNGSVKPGLLAETASYKVENMWGKVLFEGDFTPKRKWEINDLGFVLGLNKVTLNVNYIDGSTSQTSEWFMNYCEDNMTNVKINQNDPDNDNLINYLEEIYGTDPNLFDTDGDGLSDYLELVDTGTNPLQADSDDNGILDSEIDFDDDGITTIEEYDIGTSPFCVDTDGDLLSDYDEINKYKTNPCNSDTDDDKANDKWELDNGYNPLIKETSFTKSESLHDDTISAELIITTVDGTLSTLDSEIISDDYVLNNSLAGYMGNPLEFKMDGDFQSATLKISFNDIYLNEPDLLPTIYYFNETEQQFEEIQTNWDGTSNFVTAELEHFSKYILLNKKAFDLVFNKDIDISDGIEQDKTSLEFVFAIDCSASMGPTGYNNDPDNIRLKVSKEFTDKLKETDKAAVISFGSKVTTLCDFTNDKKTIKEAIDLVGNTDGYTYIASAIKTGLELFDAPNGSKRYIILLTDGKSSDVLYPDYITLANTKEVQIITISLGSKIDEEYLKCIANNTAPEGKAGLYYHATVADDLVGNFKEIENNLNIINPYKDSNSDGITDAQTKAFCNGTLTSANGKNPFEGYTYKQIQDDKDGDLDNDGIKNGDELVINKYTTKSSEIKIISSPTSKDYDNDGIADLEERDKGTDPFKADFKVADIDWLMDDDIYLSSNMSNDYLSDTWLKIQLFSGNLIFGFFNIDYVDDYTIALSNFISVLNKTDLENDTSVIIVESVKKDYYSLLKDLSTYSSIIGEIVTNTAQYQNDLVELEKLLNKLAIFESEIAKVNTFIEADGLLDSYLSLKTNASAEIITINQKYAKLMNNQEKLFTGNLSAKCAKFTCKIPEKYMQAIKATNKLNSIFYYLTIGVDTCLNAKNDINAISALYSTSLQYDKAILLLNSIIENSSNTNLVIAAKNIKNSINSDYMAFFNEAGIIIEDIAGGSAKIYKTYLVSQSGPVAWAIDAGVCLGDTLWHTSIVNQESLATIALGDASVCFSKDLRKNLYFDTPNYYTMETYNFTYLSMISQLRIVAENQFNNTAQSNSALYDLITNIKSMSLEACQSNVKRIWNISKNYSQIHCNPWYDGYNIEID